MPGQLTVRLPDHLEDALQGAAKRLNRKRSEIVRMALEQFLAVGGVTHPAGRVSGLLGSLDSGVSDLAERHRDYVLERLERGR